MLNENLWNQKERMSPKMRKFSAESATFKKESKDLAKAAAEERDALFKRNMRNLLSVKRDASERQNARKLERLIVQYKSN